VICNCQLKRDAANEPADACAVEQLRRIYENGARVLLWVFKIDFFQYFDTGVCREDLLNFRVVGNLINYADLADKCIEKINWAGKQNLT